MFLHQTFVNQSANYQKLVNLYRTHAAIEDAFGAALGSFGLSSPQWETLRILREHPGASGADIARFVRVTPQAVATMLQRLEKSELISRRSSAQGRVIEAYLTSQGEALLLEGDRVANAVQAQAFSGFNSQEQEHFNEYLLRCIANLEAR